jgi:WD40 repeat protein
VRLSELDWAYVDERAASFTGRGWVFERLRTFLGGQGGLLLLLGDPGTGKTALAAQLARAAAGRLTPAGRSDEALPALPVDAAYFCRAGKVDLRDVAQRLSDQLAEASPQFADIQRASLAPAIQIGEVHISIGKVAPGASVAGVRVDLGQLEPESAFLRGVTMPLKRLRESGDRTPVVLLVDALDESLTSPAADALPRLLGAVEQVHLVITSRDDPRAVGGLRDRAQVIDLVDDAPSGSDDVLAYLYQRLGPHGSPNVIRVLARRIAGQAAGNFLYAYYVINALIKTDRLGDLDEHAAHRVPLPEGGLPGIYREFLRRELGRDDHAWVERFRPVLAALAVAQDQGLDTEQLVRVATRLRERPMSRTAVRDVTGAARQFLDGVHPDGPFRMYHQSFAGFLVDAEHNPDFLIDPVETHAAIVAAYASTDPLDWDRYARRNLAVHAASAGQLDSLLDDIRFLLAADPDRLVPSLIAATGDHALRTARVYRSAVGQLRGRSSGEGAAYLQLHARQAGEGEVADRIDRTELIQPWSVPWAYWQPIHARQTIGRHDNRVNAVAVGEVGGQPVVVSGSDDMTVRVWDLELGSQVGEPLRGHDGPVNWVAVGQLGGRPVAVSGAGENDGTVRVWDLALGRQIGEPLSSHNWVGLKEPIRALAVGHLEGRLVAVSSLTNNGTMNVWDLELGRQVRELPLVWAHAIAVVNLSGRPMVVTGHSSGEVQVWDPKLGRQIGEPLHGGEWVRAVAVGVLGGRPVAVSGGEDQTVRVWDLELGQQVGEPLHGHDDRVTAVAVGQLDGRPVIVSASHDRTVRVWDLELGRQVGEPLRGHDGKVYAVAVGQLGGRPVAVSGGEDQTVRVWDLEGSSQVGEPPRGGHDGEVHTVVVGVLGGRPVAVSGGEDQTVRVWDLELGQQVGEPLHGHTTETKAVAVGQLEGRPVAVSAGHRVVWVWDLERGLHVSKELLDSGDMSDVGVVEAVGELAGRLVVATADLDDTVRVWDLEQGLQLGEPLRGHTERDEYLSAVAVGEIGGRPVVVTGSQHGTVRVWDLERGRLLGGRTLRGHKGEVKAVALGELAGRPVVVSGGYDGTVRMWDPESSAKLGEPLRGHESEVTAVVAGPLRDRPVAVSGSRDGTVRVWDLERRVRQVIEVGSVITSVALRPSTPLLVVGAKMGLVAIQLHPVT